MGRQWRQRPIACQSCRRRKIRCSRQFPCSNCTSRGVKCVQFYGPQEAGSSEPPPQEQHPEHVPGKPDSGGVVVSNADIKARLDRLENWIAGINGPGPGPGSVPGPSDGHIDRLRHQPSSRNAQPISPALSSTAQHLAEDLWLGGGFIFTKAKYIAPENTFFDAGVYYHLSPIRLIKKPYFILQDVTPSQLGPGSRQVCLVLPLYDEACLIVQSFTSECAIVSPTIHAPSLLSSVQGIYASIQQQTQVDRDHLLLFLSVIASVAHSCSPGDDICKLYSSHVEANLQCPIWADAAFALSDEIKRRGQPSIVCLQGQTITFKVSSYVEGSSVRTRSLLSTSIAMARDMGFHRIDMPGENVNLGSPTETEIARRLWWDIVIFDWLFAAFPGSHEGVYTINPRHMAVNKPSVIQHITPTGDGQSSSQRNDQEQTDVSYFLERIRLAELAREYVDGCPLSLASTRGGNHERLKDFDVKLNAYQQNLPSYFSLTGPDGISKSSTAKHPSLILRCVHINSLVYIERCILHIRYFSYSTIDPKYAFSRTACFECARDIIRMHRNIRLDHAWILPRLKATTFLRTLLLAGAVFLLDVCSGTEMRNLQRERPEMLEAWRFMNEMQDGSDLVEQFSEFATQMLRKYGVSQSIVSALAQELPYKADHSGNPQPPNGPSERAQSDGLSMPMDIGQRWQTLDADFDLKSMSWDNVLWGFDTIMM
ncbi:hypothetical protein QQS21_008038 [Conoideocrella luteorostrata]|uniref:Zn(2)-C6 fungal-type domain-containing protein n=1 Tax=Conoideocrella luteorostrata TaxID=1105319 RepID=A0AAJ0CMC3_9HYPO|nr:hypothetical protein QQS21_008038 [Conoideocrella luteorostrata]